MSSCPAARFAACFILVLVAGACSRTQPASTLPRTAGGKPNLGWRLKGVSGNVNEKRFAGRTYATDSLRPRLVIVYTK